MSGKIVDEVLRYAPRDLTQAQRLVLLGLANAVIDAAKDRTARTSTAKIAEQIGISPGGVRNCIRELTRRALIYPVGGKATKGHAQDYRFHHLHAHHAATQSVTPELRNSNPKRHRGVTLSPVDNPELDDAEPSQSVIVETPKRHPPMTPTGKDSTGRTSTKNLSNCVSVSANDEQAEQHTPTMSPLPPADIVARVAAIRARVNSQPGTHGLPERPPALAPLGCATAPASGLANDNEPGAKP